MARSANSRANSGLVVHVLCPMRAIVLLPVTGCDPLLCRSTADRGLGSFEILSPVPRRSQEGSANAARAEAGIDADRRRGDLDADDCDGYR